MSVSEWKSLHALTVCVCVYIVCLNDCTGGRLHCRPSSSKKQPLVSRTLPSLLRARPGLAASTKHGVVLFPYNWMSQFCQPSTEWSLLKYTCECVFVYVCGPVPLLNVYGNVWFWLFLYYRRLFGDSKLFMVLAKMNKLQVGRARIF